MKVELIIDNITKTFHIERNSPKEMMRFLLPLLVSTLLDIFFDKEDETKKQSGTEICQNALLKNAVKLVESFLVLRPFNSDILLDEDVHLDIQQLLYFGYITELEDTYGSGITSSTLRYYTFTKKARDFLKKVYVRPLKEGEIV